MIQYRWRDDKNDVSSTIIENPEGKTASLVFVHFLSSYGTAYLAAAEVSISGSSISWVRNGQVALNNNSSSQITSGPSILITKVVGLK